MCTSVGGLPIAILGFTACLLYLCMGGRYKLLVLISPRLELTSYFQRDSKAGVGR